MVGKGELADLILVVPIIKEVLVKCTVYEDFIVVLLVDTEDGKV